MLVLRVPHTLTTSELLVCVLRVTHSLTTSELLSVVWYRGYMHCDRYDDDSPPPRARDRLSGRSERGTRLSDRDEREARYWTRKLYEFEANDPDRCVSVCVFA